MSNSGADNVELCAITLRSSCLSFKAYLSDPDGLELGGDGVDRLVL